METNFGDTAVKIMGVAILIAVVLFLFAPIVDIFKNQATVYPVSIKYGVNFSDHKDVYKVFPETQTVICWVPGLDEVPTKLANCSVRDRLNWQCDFSDGSGRLTMNDGSLEIKSTILDFQSNIQYVGKLKWWLLFLTGK